MNEAGEVIVRRNLQRSELIAFFETQASCTVVVEARGAAHHWARALTGLGHEAKLIAPEVVQPFVKRGKKNDAAAICEAVSRPDARFVPVKGLEQQGVLALHPARSLLVKQQTMLANTIRGLATEFGLTVGWAWASSPACKESCRRQCGAGIRGMGALTQRGAWIG